MARLNIIILLILIGCTQQSNKGLTDKNKGGVESEHILLSPTVFTINQDSLKTFTPGLKGFPKPIVKKADHSNKQVLTGPGKVIPGISYLKQSKEDIAKGVKAVMSKKPAKFVLNEKPIINTPGKNGFELPVKYEISDPVEIDLDNVRSYRKYCIENKLYSIQNNDTILPPLVVSAKHSPPIEAKPPGFKDNSILDVKFLDIAHGLPSSNIQTILESRNGDIWLGTHGEGIARYDGKTITSFDIEHGLNHGMVEEIIEDKKGNIWIATSGNGVACYDGDKFTWYTSDQGLLSNTVWSILESRNGDIWIGTSDGLSKFDGKRIVNYTTHQGLLTNEVRKIGEDTQNNIWFGSQELTMFDGEKFKIYPSEIFSTHYFIRIKEDSRGNLWVGTVDNGVFIFDGDTITHFSIEQGFTNALIYDIYEDSKENLWFATYQDGLYKFDINSLPAVAGFTHFTEDHGLSGNIIIDLIEDSGGNLWLATAEGGISIFNPNGFYHLTENQGLLFNKVNTIKEDADGTIWLAGWGGGLIKIYGDSISHYTQKEGMVYSRKEGIFYNWIYDISFDHSGNIWATTEYGPLIGLSYFDYNTFTNYQFASYYWEPVIPHILFMSSAVDAAGTTWFGTSQSGILKFDDNAGLPKFIQYVFKELEGVPVRGLHFDQNNNLWIGTQGNGFYIYDGINFRNYTAENGLVGMEVNSFYESKNGEMWIATQSGLSHFNKKSGFKNYTTEEGLISNDIKSITQDNNDNYWITTRKGISLMTSDGKAIYNFDKQDGLKGVDFRPKSSFMDSRNKIWWGNEKAITTLDLNTFEIPTKAPKINISQILINGESHDFRALLVSGSDTLGFQFTGIPPFYNFPEGLELEYHNHDLTFQYYAIDWKAPHQLKYQYILEGKDEDWSKLTDKNYVAYGNLPYGNYTFKVKAIGAAHKWSKTLEYSFVIHPPWWHTWWARTIYGLLFILLIILIVHLRTRSLLKRQKLLQKSEEKFRGVFNSMIDVFIRRNMEGKAILVSPSVFDVTGYTVEEIIDHNISKFYVNPQLPELKRQKLLENGGIQSFEAEIYKKDGSIITISSNAKIYYDDAGNPVGIESVFRDITEQKKAADRLRESEERYQSLSEASFEAIFISEKGVCIEQNALAEKMFGYSLAEAIGMNGTEWIVPEDREIVMNKILSGDDTQAYEVTALRKDGSTFPAEIQARMMHFKGGDVRVTALNDITLRKKAEEEKRKFEKLIETTSQSVIITSIKGTVLYVNPSYYAFSGFAEDEVIGKSMFRFAHIKDARKLAKEIVPALIKKGHWQGDMTVVKKNKQIVPVDLVCSLVSDEKNKLEFFVALFSDITERKQAEEALKKSEVRLNEAQRTAHLGMWEWDIVKHEVQWSAELYKILDVDPDEIKPSKDTFIKRVHPDDRLYLEEHISAILSDKKPFSLDHRIILPSGNIRFLHSEARMEYGAKNKPARIVGISQDITERKQIEEALRESEEKFRTLITNTEEIIYMIAKDGTFLLSEGKGLSKLGLKGGDVVGKSVFELYKDFPEMIDKMRQAFNGETVIMEHEIGDIYFKSWYTPHLNQKGDIIGLLGLAVNITEQKKAELQILEYQKRLKDLATELTLSEEKVRKQIAGDLHDHVGQLLTSSRMQLSIINDNMDKAEVRKKIKNISTALLQANQATRKAIFNLSPPQLHEIGLYAAIHDWMKEQIEMKNGIKTTISGKKEKYKLDENTRLLIFRSIRELMINVTKHAKAAHLNIELKRKKDILEIVVQDDGVGFDYNSKLFKLRSKSYGLFSIQERISDLGGSMQIDSTPGKGTAIKLLVPLSDS